jgi:hypothetical protein
VARGFRSKRSFINAIYFRCGGLDLAPAAAKQEEVPLFLNDLIQG